MADAPTFPRLTNLKWRVDVCISSSHVSRVMSPSILMEMTLSDNSIRTFEVPLEKFHEFRYNTAKALREIYELESHPMLRISGK